ncbi:ABC transporter permease [Brachybacterium saurashtrense]|uniref:ABC transporter permease n=1 Tax=Brachybacterium saurashtrense TaxID=556288 RepID=A0A345YNK2_9MICO|nr:FtsX-like permease family protein [Brachybacterium saurashtrense]AXK45504.1 ABC transporter permease [Brachybacterium saurashtrense]RRR21124.1 ABC transporter permease [Brachybacterium saurashtrense]
MPRRRSVPLTPLRRHVAAVLTIALSCAFVAVTVLAGTLVQTSLRSQTAAEYEGADLEIIRALDDAAWEAQQPLPAPEVEGAEAVWPMVSTYLPLGADGADAFVHASLQAPGSDPALVEGVPAADDSEIVLDRRAADALDVGLGDSVTLPPEAAPDGQEHTLTVVGIAPAPEGAVVGGTPRVLLGTANAQALLGPTAGTLTDTWLASLPDGTDADAVAAQADGVDGLSVRTAEEAEQEAVTTALQGFAALGMVLAVFVVIALFTSAVVIANTFAVTLAQRTRALALLRTLGATRAQVRGVVLRESFAVGMLGAVLGMLGGHLLVQAALAAAAGLGWLEGVMLVPLGVWSLLLPVVAGVAITLLASLPPLRTATRVAPLQALRPAPPTPGRGLGVRSVLGTAALVLGIAALAAGTALALHGSAGPGILAAMAGGVVSFTGVLLLLVRVTRPLSALVARVVARIGALPARIAGANVARTPRRSAATIAALLIGTTLMTMMAVGARTAEATLTAELDSRRPIDLVLSAEAMPADAAERIAAVDGMDTARASARGDIEVGAEEPMTLYAATPDTLREVSHRPAMAEHLADGIVLLGQERAERFGVHDGQVLEVEGADGAEHALQVRFDANLQMSLVTPATLEQLRGDETLPVVLADVADPGTPDRAGTDMLELIEGVQEVASGEGFSAPSLVAGGAERESYAQILDVLLGITVGLLAVAVVVALVGVSNTLSLGVIERTGENALLRALGTTRGQMRAMLAWEGVLLALVGAVLGLALGSLYGVLGINALLGSTFPVSITIPWSQLALVLVLAVVAGALASVLPGGTAARTAPAAALAGAE